MVRSSYPMRFLTILIFVTIANSCDSVTEKRPDDRSPSPSPTANSIAEEKVIPDAPRTKPRFYQSIDEVAMDAGLKRLRDSTLPDDDIEVRIWGGFGLTGIDAFILRRTRSIWSAIKIGPASRADSRPRHGKARRSQIELTQPKMGWESAWQALLQNKILTIPDADSINCQGKFFDGYSYVVEIRRGVSYRTYTYMHPDEEFDNRCQQADEILAIAKIVRDEYGGF